MKQPISIAFKNISKKYRFRPEKPIIVEQLFRKQNSEFYAIRNMSFEIRRGEKVGIIGANGAGKTTMLKLMSGISPPTKGNIHVNGKIIALIELDSGFHPDLTGRENIVLSGLLVGMNKAEITKKTEAIIQYADITPFIDMPLFTYSSGMKLRLGISVALHASPDVLLIDEGINVGDRWFNQKIRNDTKLLFNKNKTIVVVSHNLYAIVEYCDRAMVIKDGAVAYQGGLDAIKHYDPTFKYEYLPASQKTQSRISRELMKEARFR